MKEESRLAFLPWFLCSMIMAVVVIAFIGHLIVAPAVGAASLTFGPTVGVTLWVAAGWLGIVVLSLAGVLGIGAYDRRTYGDSARTIPADSE